VNPEPGSASAGGELTGLCWDHPRCTRPMRAAAARWQRLTGVRLSFQTRSLASFGDQPLAAVAGRYDLIVMDHPLIGEAAASGVLVPLDEHVDASVLDDLAAHTVGPSYRSYRHAGHQWALPVDAACQVTAFRPDLMGSEPLPRTWAEVAALARRRPALVALPLQSAHALTALCTLCANAGTPVGTDDAWLSGGAAGRAIELLRVCTAATADRFGDAEPPELLNALATGHDIGYVPLVYGYVTYCEPDVPGPGCQFTDLPLGTRGPAGSTLGGAGLAVPAQSGQRDAALAFAQWACTGAVQRDVIAANGGQPAHRAAWEDRAVNAATHQFYAATRATIEAAWVRPREPWWPYFQRHGGETIRLGVTGGQPVAHVVAELRSVWEAALAAHGSAGPARGGS
jgi:multiple sugar transport system substrate-binding protein